MSRPSFVDTKSSRLGDGLDHWSSELAHCLQADNAHYLLYEYRIIGLLDVPKESLPSLANQSWRREYFMALTFGTLLSSQGADAHHHSPFGRIRGNPRYVTRLVNPGQTRYLPASRLVEPARIVAHPPVALGGKLPPRIRSSGGGSSSPRGLPGDPLEELRLGPFWRPSNKENISQRCGAQSNRPDAPRVPPCFRRFCMKFATGQGSTIRVCPG